MAIVHVNKFKLSYKSPRHKNNTLIYHPMVVLEWSVGVDIVYIDEKVNSIELGYCSNHALGRKTRV